MKPSEPPPRPVFHERKDDMLTVQRILNQGVLLGGLVGFISHLPHAPRQDQTGQAGTSRFGRALWSRPACLPGLPGCGLSCGQAGGVQEAVVTRQ
jgi:hypothetical protein